MVNLGLAGEPISRLSGENGKSGISSKKVGKDRFALSILTEHQYHLPDQSLLAQTHAAVHYNGPRDCSLAGGNFDLVRLSYVVVGWYGRLNQICDIGFLAEHGDLAATIGQGEWCCDVYEVRLDE
jgi:hypothetical protein